MFENEREIVPFFGERLKDIRETCSLTQDTLAEVTGIDRSTLAYYESGRVYPSFNRMCRLASVLCLSLDALLGSEYDIQEIWHTPPADIDSFFGITTPKESEPATPPLPPLPDHLGRLSTEEQLLVLYFRQLECDNRTQIIRDISSEVERVQRERYGLPEDNADIILDQSIPFED